MEFHSELAAYLNQKPALVVMWAAFGVPLLMAILAIPFILLRKIGVQRSGSFYSFLVMILLWNWLIGFVSQIAFISLGVPGFKMLVLWVMMFLIYGIFVSVNYSHIKKWVDKNTRIKTENMK